MPTFLDKVKYYNDEGEVQEVKPAEGGGQIYRYLVILNTTFNNKNTTTTLYLNLSKEYSTAPTLDEFKNILSALSSSEGAIEASGYYGTIGYITGLLGYNSSSNTLAFVYCEAASSGSIARSPLNGIQSWRLIRTF